MFLAPSSTTVVEAWWMTSFWDVQRTGDAVSVVAPYKDYFEGWRRNRFTEEDLALLERPLSEFETVIKEGAVARVAETGGRIAVGDDLPMLITDANLLRPYYEGPGVGISYETDAPSLPPPVPGREDQSVGGGGRRRSLRVLGSACRPVKDMSRLAVALLLGGTLFPIPGFFYGSSLS